MLGGTKHLQTKNGDEIKRVLQVFITAKGGANKDRRNEKKNEPRHEKINVQVSDLVRHKPDCTAPEDG